MASNQCNVLGLCNQLTKVHPQNGFQPVQCPRTVQSADKGASPRPQRSFCGFRLGAMCPENRSFSFSNITDRPENIIATQLKAVQKRNADHPLPVDTCQLPPLCSPPTPSINTCSLVILPYLLRHRLFCYSCGENACIVNSVGVQELN